MLEKLLLLCCDCHEMKYLSLIIFIGLLAWTWNLTHGTSSNIVSFETHAGIQEKLAQLISETIKAKKPNSSDVTITRLWTEAVDANKIRAVFAYHYNEKSEQDSDSETSIEGEALLVREEAANSDGSSWSLKKITTTNNSLDFKSGITVLPFEDGDSASEIEGQTPTGAPEGASGSH